MATFWPPLFISNTGLLILFTPWTGQVRISHQDSETALQLSTDPTWSCVKRNAAHEPNQTHSQSECDHCATKAIIFTHESTSNSCNLATIQTNYKSLPPPHLSNMPHTFNNLHQGHKTASCLLSVTPVVPDRLCLNIRARAETAAHISTFLMLELWWARAHICTCLVTQIDLDQTLKRRSKHPYSSGWLFFLYCWNHKLH